MGLRVALLPFASSNLALLKSWLARGHVSRWYPEPDENLQWAASPPSGGDHALIATNEIIVGYLRWQVVDRKTLDSVGLTEIPSGAVDIDILLGEYQHVGQGVGPAALDALVLRLSADPELSVAGLTSAADNIHAHSAFEKAGFRMTLLYSPPGYGPCHLFLRQLR